jgi:hypothetical protein
LHHPRYASCGSGAAWLGHSMPLRYAVMEPEVGFEPRTTLLRAGCSASNWTEWVGSGVLTSGALSIQSGRDGGGGNDWIIKR